MFMVDLMSYFSFTVSTEIQLQQLFDGKTR